VQKITIDAGFSCPNRDGTISSRGCLFCDGKGSGSGAAKQGQSISDQIASGKARLARRYNAKKFFAYFQAFTNTYAPSHVLGDTYDQALQDPDIVGLAIGTRPDCVDAEKLDLIQQYTKKYMVWIEYGLQSIHDRTLQTMNRGHSAEGFVEAVRMTQGRHILICAHVILGLPGESKKDILETAAALADLKIEGIKVHNLYVQKNTPLADIYHAGGFEVIDQQTYVDWVIALLERIPSDVVVQRLTGDPDSHALLAPQWARNKQETLSLIQRTLDERNTHQGRLYNSNGL
jgi:radical SAM protein (TIGR01212 family)